VVSSNYEHFGRSSTVTCLKVNKKQVNKCIRDSLRISVHRTANAVKIFF
jgi:hypothetical protein